MHQSSELQTASPDMPENVRNVLEKLGLPLLVTVEEIRECLSEPLSFIPLTDAERDALIDYYGVSPAGLGFFESKAEMATDPDVAKELEAKLAQTEKDILKRMRATKIAQDPEAAARRGITIASLRSMNPPGDSGIDRVQRIVDALNSRLNR